jgi:hypothetical protein
MDDVFLPVLESAMVIAAHYAKACGRDCVLAQDVCLGLKFAARHVVGKQVGSFFPEIYQESESESGSEDSGSESEPEEPTWSRYDGPDEKLRLVNECADTWDAWEPETPAERIIKGAVEKAALVV